MTEAMRAHQRLMETMPRERIRTHHRPQRNEVGRMGGRERLPVEVDGVYYPSLNDAARALGLARETVRSMVRRGEAILV
jgi:hypothetical protein